MVHGMVGSVVLVQKAVVRILLIEDDEMDAEYLKLRLQSRHELSFADGLESGIEQCNLLKPDVIMVDLGLPDSSNHRETLSKITKARQKSAVIVITGHDATKEFIDDCIRFSTDGFIIKGRGDKTAALLDEELEKAVRHRARSLANIPP